MSVLALSCSRFFARFSGTSIRKDCLDRLPNDVLIDGVMSYLDILDILRLRRVSWLYYQLTHHAAVWKRLLRSANIPLPPLPPTARHTPAQMTGLEVERLLCRAYSLDLNWRRRSPRCILEWQLNAYHRVLEMVLLPGGRYLVASVTDPSEEQYSLVVYTVDPPALSKPIAKTGTEMKAYALRAKFVTIKGQKSLAIAYIRRTYHHKTDRLNCAKGFLPNVSQYSTYHEIDMEFRYECVAIHARLSALETLTDLSNNLSTAKFVEEASRLPPPFEHLVCIRSGPAHRLLCPDIEEIFDSAYLAVAKWPNDIILKRLDGGPAVTLTCMQAPVYAQAVC
ncbi:hypothetical protein BD414DRAFT_424052 [Trametes punicea]|nr:hypothetical protein BD414DRAFT_424052 [Trametes punicea]